MQDEELAEQEEKVVREVEVAEEEKKKTNRNR